MVDERTDKLLTKLKDEIPVNELLKKELKNKLEQKNKKSETIFKKITAFAAVAAAIAITILMIPQGDLVQKANAASLKIAAYASIAEIGGGSTLGVAEYKGKLYIPVAGKGIYEFSKKANKQVAEGDISTVKISSDGEKLLYSFKNGIYLYNLTTGEKTLLLENGESGDSHLIYDAPSWGADNDSIIVTKKIIAARETHGFYEKESIILEMDLITGKTLKLAEGTSACIVSGTGDLVLERNMKLYYKEGKTGKEIEFDKGRFPSVSPDGNMIAYVKNTTSRRELNKNIFITESIDNIWLADTKDLSIKRKITSNYAFKFITEKEWLESLKPATIPQGLAYNGLYSFYNPVWSSDSKTLYALKNSNAAGEASGNMKIIKIQFTTTRLTAVQTIMQYMQALITRDDEFAKGLMVKPPDILTLSNPVQVGYEITASGKEDGKEYVAAEASWSYTANAWFRLADSRFYMTKNGSNYKIDSIVEKDTLEIYDKGGTLWLATGETTKKLVDLKSLSVNLSSGSSTARFSPLAYNKASDTVIFSVQSTINEKTSVSVFSLNLKTGSQELLTELDNINGLKDNIGLSRLTISATGKYTALDLFSHNEAGYTSQTIVLDIKRKQAVLIGKLLNTDISSSTGTVYWEGDNLVFSLNTDQQSFRYIYNTLTQKVNLF